MKAILFALAFCATALSAYSQTDSYLLPPKEFAAKIKSSSNAQIVDVRTPEEFAQGKIDKAVNINFFDANFDALVGKLDKNKPVFVYCAVGGRSAKAYAKLKQMQFNTVFELKGGYNAWKAAAQK